MSTLTANPTTVSPGKPRIDPARPLRVGDLLLAKGLVTAEQIDTALDYQKSRGHKKLLGEVLVELEFVTNEQVMEVLAEAYGVPFAHVGPKVADPTVIELLPRDFLEKQCVLPLFLVQSKLTLAVHEPANVFVIEEVERLTGHSVQVVAAPAKDIIATLEAHLPNANVFVIDDLATDLADSDLSVVEKEIADLSDIESTGDESPVIKLVNYVVGAAVQDGASDIHIEPGDGLLRVRYRVDGQLFTKMTPPHRMLPAVVSRIKIMASLDISERRVPQDGGITVMVDKRQIDLRVSTCPGKFGEKVVIRIIDTRNAMTGLEKLGFSDDMLTRWKEIVHQPNGVVLVTGPTGSGKSTTLYATLNEINDESINISTVEDPVEYAVPGINQFQTNDKAGFTFAGALRSLLRQDPDVVMLGEIRDQETARIATQAALTGHLVLSTLHTNDAVSAVTRLFNVGVEPYLVAAAVRGVLSQRLVRRVCSQCKEPQELTPQMARTLEKLGGAHLETVYHGTGCAKCRNTGYSGRVGIYGLYIPDDEGLDAISRGAGLQELRKVAKAGSAADTAAASDVSAGTYITLSDDGIQKVAEGLTTLEELFTATTM